MVFLYACLLLVLAVQNTWACSCMPHHPHNQVCGAEAALKGRITSKVSSSMYMNYVHGVAIEEIFKDDEWSLEGVDRILVETASQGSLCGVSLAVGQSYFLQLSRSWNGRWTTGLCTMTRPWPTNDTFADELATFLRQMDCNCTVKECRTPFHSPDQVQECLSERLLYNECLHHPYINSMGTPCESQGRTCQMNGGFCDWTPSLPSGCMPPNAAPGGSGDSTGSDVTTTLVDGHNSSGQGEEVDHSGLSIGGHQDNGEFSPSTEDGETEGWAATEPSIFVPGDISPPDKVEGGDYGGENTLGEEGEDP